MDREAWQATVHGVLKSRMRLSDSHSLTPLQTEKLTSCNWTRRSQVFLPQGSYRWGFPSGSNGKEPACNVGDLGSIPEWGRSPGERSLAGYSPWGPKELAAAEWLTLTFSAGSTPSRWGTVSFFPEKGKWGHLLQSLYILFFQSASHPCPKTATFSNFSYSID